MLDKMEISKRFFLCHPGLSRGDVARIYGVRRTFVTGWATKGTITWSALKYLSDSQAISWDWLLAGHEPRESTKEAKTPKSAKPKFARPGINRRFLSLYPNMRKSAIAVELGVTFSTVRDWKENIRQVSWERLDEAVQTFGVRWDWLIDGLEPKYYNAPKSEE